MAHYERLANGKYSYTTTVQIISGEDFTNPNHSFITGTLPLYIGLTQTSPTQLALIPQFSQGSSYTYTIYATPQVHVGSSSSAPDPFYNITPNYWNLVSKTIGDQTYWGLKSNETNNEVCIVVYFKSNGSYSIWLSACDIVLTYIEAATNTIKTKTIHSDYNYFEKKSGNTRFYSIYICLGISKEDIILNLKLS